MVERRLSLAVFDGMLLAAWSANPDGVRELVWRLEHGKPVSPLLNDFPDALRFDGDQPPHRGWVRGPPLGVPFNPALALWEATDRSLVLSLDGRFDAASSLPPAAATGSPPFAAPSAIPADAPVLSVLVEQALLRQWESSLSEGWFPGEETPDRLLAWLTGAPYEGRILGVLKPAFFVAAPASRFPETDTIRQAIDRINAHWDVGLTYRWASVDAFPPPTMVLDSSRLGFAGLRPQNGHQGLLGLQDGWLIAGTSAASWRRQQNASAGNRHSEWHTWLGEPQPEQWLRLWANPSGLAREIRHVLALYRLARLLGGVAPSPALLELEQGLPAAADMLDALAPFGPLRAEVRQLEGTPARLRLKLHLGEREPKSGDQ